jgi:hypothetical protein
MHPLSELIPQKDQMKKCDEQSKGWNQGVTHVHERVE